MPITMEDLEKKVDYFASGFDERIKLVEKDTSNIRSDFERMRREDILPMRTQVGEIREKVFNGLSETPKRLRILMAVGTSIAIALLALMLQVGLTQGRLMAKIETLSEQLAE